MIGNKYILAAVLACAPLATQAAETVYTFATVTGIEHRSSDVLIHGIPVNDTTIQTVILPWDAEYAAGSIHDRCEKVFNVVLSQPAAYTLTVATEWQTIPSGPVNVLKYVFTHCRADLKS